MSTIPRENICSNCLKQADVHLICVECDCVQLCVAVSFVNSLLLAVLLLRCWVWNTQEKSWLSSFGKYSVIPPLITVETKFAATLYSRGLEFWGGIESSWSFGAVWNWKLVRVFIPTQFTFLREDIALKVGTKSSEECMYHYCNRYLGGVFGLELLNDNKYPSRITDHTNHVVLSPMQPPHSSYIDIEDQQLLGYMPNRGDFERVSFVQPLSFIYFFIGLWQRCWEHTM